MSGAGTPVQAVIFGGTTEGRQLADFCGQRGIRCAVCVVSSYGEELLPETEWVRRETGARTAEEMAKLLGRLRPALVLDATHPYAVQASENIRLACEETGLDCLRVVRQSGAAEAARAAGAGGEETPRIRYVRDAAEAAEALAGTRGPVFVTTGSKELEAFARLENWQERIYVRVLPDSRVLAQCEAMGFARGHVIAMQGPFSADLNAARSARLSGGVSGDPRSRGAAGGFAEKMEAAARLGIPAVVIGRPRQESGISAEEACRRLARLGTERKRQIFLTGIGMGWTGTADAGGGAGAAAGGRCRRRATDAGKRGETFERKAGVRGYACEGILDWFEKHPELASLAVVYSGTRDFTAGRKGSGGRQSAGKRQEAKPLTCVRWPAYLRWRFCVLGWGFPGSRCIPPAATDGRRTRRRCCGTMPRCFCCWKGGDGAAQVCRQLTEAGYGDARVTVGERLSYPEERVVTAAASQMGETRFDGLCAMLIRR